MPFASSTALGDPTDPTGLFSPQEVAEGASVAQPSIRYAVVAVTGGTVTITTFVGHWCGVSECPARFRLVMDDGAVVNSTSSPDDCMMICQADGARSFVTVDPVRLTMTACAQGIDLTRPER